MPYIKKNTDYELIAYCPDFPDYAVSKIFPKGQLGQPCVEAHIIALELIDAFYKDQEVEILIEFWAWIESKQGYQEDVWYSTRARFSKKLGRVVSPTTPKRVIVNSRELRFRSIKLVPAPHLLN